MHMFQLSPVTTANTTESSSAASLRALPHSSYICKKHVKYYCNISILTLSPKSF